MDISTIIIPVISLGSMGLIFGGILAYASQKFAIKIDQRISEISDILPGANCGGCGFPGCDSFADAVVNKRAPISGCPVGGTEITEKISRIMGVETEKKIREVAHIICSGDELKCKNRFEYSGIQDCRAATMIAGGAKGCKYGCLGLGTCLQVCAFNAIEITDDKIAKIIPERCTACGKCIKACPKQVISLVPYEQNVIVDCNNTEKGKDVRSKCSIGCIACQMCVKACPFDAMEFSNNLAKINYDKCTNCMICAEKCPTGAIYASFKEKK